MARKKKIEKKKEPKITLYEEDLYQEEVKEKTVQFLVFRLSGEWYGVELTEAKEVVKVLRITYLPSSPEHIAGIINVRGTILSVTDLKTIFGLPQEELTEKSRLVVIEHGLLETALLVDEVWEVIEVPVSKIDPTLTTIPPERAEYIEGQCKIEDKLIAILNVEKILAKQENRSD
jgi:purine-binding chemotaxis protein CheW